MKINILCFKSSLLGNQKPAQQEIEHFVEWWNSIKESGKDQDINISVCTDCIPNFVGNAIYEGKIHHSDVTVRYQDEVDKLSFSEASYSEDGLLVDFPYGYFGWDYQLLHKLK